MEEQFVIQYSPEPKDYIRASRMLAMKSRGFIIMGVIAIIGIIASIVILLIPSTSGTMWRFVGAIVILVGVFYFINILVIVPLELSRTYKKNEHLRKARKFFFSDSRIAIQIEGQAKELDWDKIQKALKGNDFYLLIYKADKGFYPVIPERAFTTDEQKTQFLDLLKRKNIPVK